MIEVFGITTPLGQAWAEFEADALIRFTMRTLEASGPIDERAKRLQKQMDAYFAGSLHAFDIELAPHGTDFQHRVWKALLEIPYGHISTYGAIAQKLGDPNATRAVGSANGQNPIWILIPCHRVIGANGHLTGYAGGLDVKARLLEIEGLQTRDLFGEVMA